MIRLHHVQVACPEHGEEQARAFYGALLGLTEVPKPPVLARRGGVWFRGDGYELHLGVEDPFTPARKAHPAFLVDDLDAIASALTIAGHVVAFDDDTFPGYRRFHAFDPFGNRVEFLSTAPSVA